MAGLYIHIPFCKSRCIYCGFYSTTHIELRQKYIDSICKEMTLRSEDDFDVYSSLHLSSLSTIYLGGGTPSQLSIAQLEQLFTYIYNVYNVNEDAEITMECNPDDITEEYAQAISRLPINRISMGIQTFDNERLVFLKRRHNAEQTVKAVERLRNVGINNISIDLMYGFPNETLKEWESDIDKAMGLGVEHISAYSLMVEDDTPLSNMVKSGEIKEADEEISLAMYNLLINKLDEQGYEHYEISNFAKQGFQSRHNSNYWHDIPYIGLGTAAHSYYITKRQWNVSNIMKYIESIERGIIPMEYEIIDQDTRYNDSITTALRTAIGLNLSDLSKKHKEYCLQCAEPHLRTGMLEIKENHLRITKKGIFISDSIMSDLIYID